MADWKREIGAISLFAPDLGEARKFYADVFGLDAQPVEDDIAMRRRSPGLSALLAGGHRRVQLRADFQPSSPLANPRNAAAMSSRLSTSAR